MLDGLLTIRLVKFSSRYPKTVNPKAGKIAYAIAHAGNGRSIPAGFTIQLRFSNPSNFRDGAKSASMGSILMSALGPAASREADTNAMVTAKFARKLRIGLVSHGDRRKCEK